MKQRLCRIIEASDRFDARAVSYAELERKPLFNQESTVVLADLTTGEKNAESLLKQMLVKQPTRLALISSRQESSLAAANSLLDSGAIASLSITPHGESSLFSESTQHELIKLLVTTSRIRVVRPQTKRTLIASAERQSRLPRSGQNVSSPKKADVRNGAPDLIAIAASTGGPEVIRDLLAMLDRLVYVPPILIVQHMHPRFTKAFASELDAKSRLEVAEATDQQEPLPNHVYICPGDFHMQVDANSRIRLTREAPQNYSRPSADILFESIAGHCADRSLCIILTGMGSDGARGIGEARRKGATTCAQSPQSCSVETMPQQAIQRGAIQWVLAPREIGLRIKSILHFNSQPDSIR